MLPYCGADPRACKRLEEAGCAAVMPLGAPIGSNQGPVTRGPSSSSSQSCPWWWMQA